MLPREHRLTRGADFRTVMRRGARAAAEGMVVSVHLVTATPTRSQDTADTAPWRCGLIVSKAVGNAVIRHRTQRRLRHIIRDILDAPDGPLSQHLLGSASGTHHGPGHGPSAGSAPRVDVVIRALPEITELDHTALYDQLSRAVQRALQKARSGPRGGRRS